MLSVRAIEEVDAILGDPADFHLPHHETNYRTVLDMYAASSSTPRIDPITLAAELQRRGDLVRVGGPAYLHALVNTVPTTGHAAHYVEIVRERAALRRVIEAGTRMVQLAHAGTEEAGQVVEEAMAELQAAAEGTSTAEPPLPVWEATTGCPRSPGRSPRCTSTASCCVPRGRAGPSGGGCRTSCSTRVPTSTECGTGWTTGGR